MQQKGYPCLQNYIDDLIYIGLPSSIDRAYLSLLDLLQEIGLKISNKKLHPPDTEVVCLRILIDTMHRTSFSTHHGERVFSNSVVKLTSYSEYTVLFYLIIQYFRFIILST